MADFQRSEDRQRVMGNHNHGTGWAESSEWLIVAMKQGNACGAKGPYCNYAKHWAEGLNAPENKARVFRPV